MTVYKNNRDKWCIDINYEGGRVRKTATRQTRRGAESEERAIRQQIADGTYGQATGDMLLGDMLDDYLAHARARLEASTHHGYVVLADTHIRPSLGAFELAEVNARRVSKLCSGMLEQGRNPRTVNRMLTVLRQTLRLAIEWGELDRLPQMKRLKEPPSKWRYLDRAELAALVALERESPWSDMILVAMHTGLRLGELRALRWSDVRLEVGMVEVNRAAWLDVVGIPKHGSVRTVPLNAAAAAALRTARHLKGELVFCDESGEMLATHTCETALKRRARRAGLMPFGWHVLRHTFASYCAVSCSDLRVVKELLGHKDIQTTMRYAHLLPGMRRSAVDAMCGNMAATPPSSSQETNAPGRT